MKWKIVFRREAKAELDEARRWYDQRRAGLGADFFLCVEETLERILRHPDMCAVVFHNVRQALVRRFPYAIYFLLEGERIVVVAVFHTSRNPEEW